MAVIGSGRSAGGGRAGERRPGRAGGRALAGGVLAAALLASLVVSVPASASPGAPPPGSPAVPPHAAAGALPPAARGAPPSGLPAPPAVRAVAALPPAPLPPAAPPATTIDPVAFTPGARDATGARQARAERPLKLVAVTWNGPAPDRVDVRSTDAAGRWGTWTALDPAGSERDDLPAGRAEKGGTEPIWVGERTAVEVRATRAGAPVTDAVQVVRIDPGVSSNDARVGRTGRGAAEPAYVTRAQWGADESLMTWPPQTAPTTKAVTIHHTAESNDYGPADSAAIVRGIYAYHAMSQGWGDIGYNAMVDKFGTIFEGRAGGLANNVVAAHAGGFNQETFGIAMLGDLQTTPATPPQSESVAALSAWKLGGLYRDPEQKVSLTSSGGGTSRFPKGEAAEVPALFAHRDVGETACPGDSAYAAMPGLRTRVRDLINAAAPDVRLAWSAGRSSLGEPTRVESPTAGGRGRWTAFERGTVYWSPTTGAWEVVGAIADHWRALGAERSTLGYPTSGEYVVPTGRQQNFERGALTWNRATGAVAAAG